MGKFYIQELCETRMKSKICAKGSFEMGKLTDSSQPFLECRIEEEKEKVNFYYNIQETNALAALREEKKINKLRALLEVERLYQVFLKYNFMLDPENLYYDRNYRIFIKNRDLYERGISGKEENFLTQYKALIGYVMQKKYTFEDYYQGGNDLYHKNSFLKKMNERNSIEEIYDFLKEEFELTNDIILHRKVEVNKSWYRLNSFCMAAAILLLASAVGVISYLVLAYLPRRNAMLNASECFLEGNYVKVIDDLQSIDMKYMDKYQKYILAVSYVRGESLTPEQKENILNSLTIDGEEKIKDYWIYLGRLDTAEAENIAMQCSDDELLLYAYMTEKAILEKNTEISGEEKLQRLSELEKKIAELAKQYEVEDEKIAGE